MTELILGLVVGALLGLAGGLYIADQCESQKLEKLEFELQVTKNELLMTQEYFINTVVKLCGRQDKPETSA